MCNTFVILEERFNTVSNLTLLQSVIFIVYEDVNVCLLPALTFRCDISASHRQSYKERYAAPETFSTWLKLFCGREHCWLQSYTCSFEARYIENMTHDIVTWLLTQVKLVDYS